MLSNVEFKMSVENVWSKISSRAEKITEGTILADNFTEFDTRAALIDPLLEALGWDPFEDIRRGVSCKPAPKKLDEEMKSNEQNPDDAKKSNNSNFIDYVLFLESKLKILVEAKSFGTKFTPTHQQQVEKYADYLSEKYECNNFWYVWTDGTKYKIWQYDGKQIVDDFDLRVNDSEFVTLFDQHLLYISKPALSIP
jgi:type I site-specific restriction endonuclease